MKNLFTLIFLFTLIGCTTGKKEAPLQSIEIETGNPNYTQVDKKHKQLLEEGENLLLRKQAQTAIDQYFNLVIQDYMTIYHNKQDELYNARTKKEHDFYMKEAKRKKKKAHILSNIWAKAYYLKAYALLEQKSIRPAKKALEKALTLSPSNAQYLSEMGHILHIEKKWNNALNIYRKAELSSNLFSPDDVQREELLRAKRGIGFSLTELKKVVEAKKIYQEILRIDPQDKIAKRELKYLQELKNRD